MIDGDLADGTGPGLVATSEFADTDQPGTGNMVEAYMYSPLRSQKLKE